MAKRKQVISYTPIYRIMLVRDGDFPTERVQISCPDDGAALIGRYLEHADREHLVVVMVDTRNQLIGINTAAIGTLNFAAMHPREVFKPAILCNAAAILVGHNHVSGCPEPSHEDIKIAQRLKESAKVIDMQLMDFIIVTDDGPHVSFKERGIL
jgi:DNA repair protein RadC